MLPMEGGGGELDNMEKASVWHGSAGCRAGSGVGKHSGSGRVNRFSPSFHPGYPASIRQVKSQANTEWPVILYRRCQTKHNDLIHPNIIHCANDPSNQSLALWPKSAGELSLLTMMMVQARTDPDKALYLMLLLMSAVRPSTWP